MNKKKVIVTCLILGTPLVILFLATGVRFNSGHKVEALIQIEMKQIKMAVTQYVSVFNEYPIQLNQTDKDVIIDSSNESFFSPLLGENSRNQRFIIRHENLMIDRKNNPYIIILDSNNDDKIKFKNKIFDERVILYSYGRNGKNENGFGDDLSTVE